MPSFQCRMMYFMMRNRHLFRLRLKQEAWDEHTSIPDFRRECEQLSSRMSAVPQGVTIEPVTIEHLYAEWLLSPAGRKDPVILYAIGGGYVSGSCQDHRGFVGKLVGASGVSVLLVEHRLAPEHPFPAPLEDLVTAYRWLLKQDIPPARIMIVGESAGGGLCLATLLALRDHGIPLPAAGVAISPWTDLTLSSDSYHRNAKVCLSPPNMAAVCSRYYVGDHDPRHPWISPLHGDLHGLPPLFISAGGHDTLCDDATRFAGKAKAAGIDVTLQFGDGMCHCYPLLSPLFPEAKQAMDEICAFIRSHIPVDTRPDHASSP